MWRLIALTGVLVVLMLWLLPSAEGTEAHGIGANRTPTVVVLCLVPEGCTRVPNGPGPNGPPPRIP